MPLVPGLKVTRCVEAFKKVREYELHCLEVVVRVAFTSGPRATPTSEPFDLLLLFKGLWMETKLGLGHSHFLL